MRITHKHANVITMLLIPALVFFNGMIRIGDKENALKAQQSQPTAAPTAGESNTDLSDNPADALASLEREGITVAIEQVIAGNSQLMIRINISGLPENYFNPENAQSFADALDESTDEPFSEQIRLADNTYLEFYGGNCEGSGDLASSQLLCLYNYSPLPEGVNEFTLEMQRLPAAPANAFPEDWEIPVQLSEEILSGEIRDVQKPNLANQNKGGITLQLLQTRQTPTETAFQLGLEWEGQRRMIHHTAPIKLQDQQDRYYILSGGPGQEIHFPENIREGDSNFALLATLITNPISENGPLTFHLDWVIMLLNEPIELQFTFDDEIQADQTWTVNEKIIMDHFDLEIKKIHFRENLDGTQTFEFEIEAPQDVVGVNLSANIQSWSSDSGYSQDRDILISRITSSDFPNRPPSFTVSEVLYKVEGPWEIAWQPEPLDLTAAPSPTAAPTRMAVPTPTIIPSEPCLSDLATLLARAEEEKPEGPGWIHQTLEISQTQPPAMLDSGDMIEEPLNKQTDIWYYLDEDGNAQTTVTIRKTLDGTIYSADISDGPYHFSIPEGRGSIEESIYMAEPSFNLNLLSTFNGYLQEGGSIHTEDSNLDGRTCQLYEARLPYDPPQTFTGEELAVTTLVYSACIDPTSRQVLQVQNHMDYIDGTSKLKGTTRFLVLEKVNSLPEEVSEILESVVIP